MHLENALRTDRQEHIRQQPDLPTCECRPANQVEWKRKREEIRWEPSRGQKPKKSRNEREGSREREHKHKHKEKCAPWPQRIMALAAAQLDPLQTGICTAQMQ